MAGYDADFVLRRDRGHQRQTLLPPPTWREGTIVPGDLSEKDHWQGTTLRVWDHLPAAGDNALKDQPRAATKTLEETLKGC